MVQEINDKGAYDAKKASGKLVVDYHATWCGPCKAEIPHLQKIEKKYPQYADLCLLPSWLLLRAHWVLLMRVFYFELLTLFASFLGRCNSNQLY